MLRLGCVRQGCFEVFRTLRMMARMTALLRSFIAVLLYGGWPTRGCILWVVEWSTAAFGGICVINYVKVLKIRSKRTIFV